MAQATWFGPGTERRHTSCELEVKHCHVKGQLYYSQKELEAVYPGGEIPVADLDLMDLVRNGITVLTPAGSGPASNHSSPPALDHNFQPASQSDHRNHVHVSLNAGVRPGTIMTKDPSGMVRPAKPGETPVGVAGRILGVGKVEINLTNGQTMAGDGTIWTLPENIQPASPPWSDPASTPMSDIRRWISTSFSIPPSSVGRLQENS